MKTCQIWIARMVAVLLLTAAHVGNLTAGTFVAQPPNYNNTVTSTTFTTRIAGQAVYQGTPDANDITALIQTRENDSRPNQTDGNGANYYGPFVTNQVMNCTTNSCMGWAAIARPWCSDPSITYSGRNGSFIYHQSGIEISTYTGYSYLVPCKPELPPHCFTDSVGAMEIAPVEGGAQIAAIEPFQGYRPSRVEDAGEMSYLMDDWAVVAIEVDDQQTVVSVDLETTSSREFGQAVQDGWLGGAEQSRNQVLGFSSSKESRLEGRLREGRSVALVVGGPVHPRNSRWIPTPALRLETELPSEKPGTAILRVQAEHGGAPSGFDVIWSSRELSKEEAVALQSGVRFEYASDDMVHRVVGFAIVDFDEEQLSLKRTIVILPDCCCGGETCL